MNYKVIKVRRPDGTEGELQLTFQEVGGPRLELENTVFQDETSSWSLLVEEGPYRRRLLEAIDAFILTVKDLTTVHNFMAELNLDSINMQGSLPSYSPQPRTLGEHLEWDDAPR